MNAKTQHRRLEEDLGWSIVEPSRGFKGSLACSAPREEGLSPPTSGPLVALGVSRFAFCEELWQVQPR